MQNYQSCFKLMLFVKKHSRTHSSNFSLLVKIGIAAAELLALSKGNAIITITLMFEFLQTANCLSLVLQQRNCICLDLKKYVGEFKSASNAFLVS